MENEKQEVKKKVEHSLGMKIGFVGSLLLLVIVIIVGVFLALDNFDDKTKDPVKQVEKSPEIVEEDEINVEDEDIKQEEKEDQQDEKNDNSTTEKPKEEIKKPENNTQKEENSSEVTKDDSSKDTKEDLEQKDDSQSAGKEDVQEEKEEVAFEKHFVKDINISYPSNWTLVNQGVTAKIIQKDINASYVAVYSKTPFSGSDLSYFDGWYSNATSIERKFINGHEWLVVVSHDGTKKTTEFIAVKNGWCYNVETVIKDGLNEDVINQIVNTVTIP